MKKRKTHTLEDRSSRIFDVVVIVFLVILSALVIYPLWYVLIASFTDPAVVNTGRFLLYPVRPSLNGYEKILQYPPLWTAYGNTILYTVVGTVVAVAITIPAAYALSRYDLFGRRPLMMLFSFTMFFSGGIIPLFLQIQKLGIYDTIWAVVLPTAVSVWNLIVCRSFFESNIPLELLEASRIDGTNDFGFFFRIVIPLSPTIITVMILFYGTALWNSFMNPLMFLQSIDKMPLQVVLRNLVMSAQVSSMIGDAAEAAEMQKMAEQLKYGIITVSALPLLLLYPFLQEYFVKGVSVGAVKG